MAAKLSTVKAGARLLKQSVKCFMADDGLRLAAALAYYSAFSLAPLLLVAIAIAGFFLGEQAAQGVLAGELRDSLGASGAQVVEQMLAQAAQKPSGNVIMTVVGMVILLVGAGGLFAQMQASLNKIWNAEDENPQQAGWKRFLCKRLLAFSMVLVSGFLLLVSMILSAVLKAMQKFVGEIAGLPVQVWSWLGATLSFLVITTLLAAIFKWLPNTSIRWKDVWVGAFFTAALFAVGKTAISWYLGYQSGSSYGAAAAFTVVLTWLYYTGIIFLVGAEFTEVYTRAKHPENPRR